MINMIERVLIEKSIDDVDSVMDIAKKDLSDAMYIGIRPFVPEKKDIKRCYLTGFSLKTKKEIGSLIDQNDHMVKHADFFVCNEKTGELLPFKQGDMIIYENGAGYMLFDGKAYISYNDDGIEVWRHSYHHEKEDPNIQDIPEFQRKWNNRSKASAA